MEGVTPRFTKTSEEENSKITPKIIPPKKNHRSCGRCYAQIYQNPEEEKSKNTPNKLFPKN